MITAEIGLFVTLAPSTDPMRKEAIKEGFYESPTFGSFPKIQILTIEGLMNGTDRPQYPDLSKGSYMGKRAVVEPKTVEQKELFE